MIKYILFFLNLSALAYGQQIKVACGDTISHEAFGNEFRIEVGHDKISFKPENVDNLFSTKLDVHCIEKGFDLILTKKNGNEYEISHFIFSKVGENYFWDKCYLEMSNRQDAGLSGAYVENIPFRDFKGMSGRIENNFKSISYTSGLQGEDAKESIDYYSLVEKAFKKKKYDDVRIFTDRFVIEWKDAINQESAEHLNNLGFYAYKAGAFSNAINILSAVIKKYPERVVAYLNIADSYWAVDDKEKARINYNHYVEIMKRQNKDLKKIPEYVTKRLN